MDCFLNGRSLGILTRNPDDFPSLGLRWKTPFREGSNEIRAVAYTADGGTLEDTVTFHYDPAPPGAPNHLVLRALAGDTEARAVVEVTVRDARDRVCVEAAIRLRAEVAGSAELLCNQGTARGSAVLQTAGGRALFTLCDMQGPMAFAVHPEEGLASALRVFDPADFSV